MSASPSNGDDKSMPPKSSTVILLLITMADTTWRMFVPTLGCMVGGLAADKWLHSTPWLTGLGLVVGVGLAAFLVKDQLKRVQQP